MPNSQPSICRFCHATCPILVEKDDAGRVLRVTGDKSNPLYAGYCCIKGQQLPEQLTLPERLLHSMKRQPDGEHAPIASERMLDEIAAKLSAILEEHGPRAVAMYSGTYSANGNMATNPMSFAFLKAIRSRMAFSSNTIDQPGKAVALGLHGAWMAPPQGFAEADVALLVGGNPLVAISGGLPHSNPARALKQKLEAGFQLIVIDPRRSETARRAHIHLQPLPGHDVEILAAMLRVITREGLHDAEFLAQEVDGFEALCAAVEPFTPERVAATAGIEAEDLVRAARLFATAGRGVATAGTGPNMSGQGTLFEYLMISLNTVCGRWLRAGERVPNPGALVPTVSHTAQAIPPWRAYGFGEKLRVRGLANTTAGMPTAALADEILLEGPERVRALINVGGNPVAAWPDQLKTIAAMQKLDLLVQIDIKMSATAKLAHYVVAPKLPLEMPGMTQGGDYLAMYGIGFGWPEAYAQYTPAVVEPPAGSDVIEEWRLFYGLAQRMGLQLELKPVALIGPPGGKPHELDMQHAPTTDELYEMLTEGSRISLAEVKRHPHGATFPDPPVFVEPKAEGHAGRLMVGDAQMLADLAQVARGGTSQAEPLDLSGGEHPFRLVSRRSMNALNSSGRDLSGLTRSRSTNPAYMHPDDLARLGLQSGDLVEIRSARASILGVAEPDATLRTGLVSMTHSYGELPARDGEVRAIGSNTGRLTSVDVDYDRYSGMPRMSNIPVDVRPAG